MAVKMMLFENGSTGPVAVCDVCGKVIRDAQDEGTVYWRRPQAFDEKAGHTYGAVIVCGRDACEMAAEKGGGNMLSTMDLSTALGYLLANTGMRPSSRS